MKISVRGIAAVFLISTLAALPAPVTGKGAYTSLYLFSPDHRLLQPLDPQTLADLTIEPALHTGANVHCMGSCGLPWIFGDRMGSRVGVAVNPYFDVRQAQNPRSVTIRLFSSFTGDKEAQFHPKVVFLPQGINSRGTRVYGVAPMPSIYSIQPAVWNTWYSVDVAVGDVTRRIPLPAGSVAVQADLEHSRLFVLQQNGNASQTAPRPATLVVIDTRTGLQQGSMLLDRIMAGSWKGATTSNGFQLYDRSRPGIALSPDGTRLAVLDGQTQSLTVVDTQRLTIVRTVSVVRRQSLLEKAGTWLGLLPTAAMAKGSVGESIELNLRYSLDGSRLYAWAMQNNYATGQVNSVQAIDATTGEVLGQTSDEWVGTSWDSSAVYTLHTNESGDSVLQRRDPITLAVQAERLFAGLPHFVTTDSPS